MTFDVCDRAILFADLARSSELSDAQKAGYFSQLLKDISEVLVKHAAQGSNTWGDGLVSFFEDASTAAKAAIELKSIFEVKNPGPSIRVSLHWGKVFKGVDPITGRDGFLGRDVDFAARLEPMAPPNGVLASSAFVAQLGSSSWITPISLGVRQLPKSGKEAEVFLLVSVPFRTPVEDYVQADGLHDPFLIAAAEAAFGIIRESLKNPGSLPKVDRESVLNDEQFHTRLSRELATLSSGDSIIAVCGAHLLGSIHVEEYWNSNFHAARRGVQLQRVFFAPPRKNTPAGKRDKRSFNAALKAHFDAAKTSPTNISIRTIDPKKRIGIAAAVPDQCGFLAVSRPENSFVAVRQAFKGADRPQLIGRLLYRPYPLELFRYIFLAAWSIGVNPPPPKGGYTARAEDGESDQTRGATGEN